MPDVIKLIGFALISFILGHTFSNKIKDESVASFAFSADSTYIALMVLREKELQRFPDSLIYPSPSVSNPYFLLKAEEKNQVRWVKHIGGTPFELPDRILLDDSSNIYLTGSVNTQFSFNNVSYSLGEANTFENIAYLVKFDPEGKQLWASFIPGLDIYRPYTIWFEDFGPMIEGYFNGQLRRTALWHEKYIYWR